MKKTRLAILFVSLTIVVGVVLLARRKSSTATLSHKSYLGLSKDSSGRVLTRGFRNNNVGNIRISSTAWAGKIAISKNTDKAFEQFIEFRYGTLAMIILLKRYVTGGTNTLRKIIYKYAPPSENNSANYLAQISTWSGLRLDSVLKADKETLRKLVITMARLESGVGFTNQDFEEAYTLLR